MDNNSVNKNLYYLHQKLLKHMLEIKPIEQFADAADKLEIANQALLEAMSLLANQAGNKELYIKTGALKTETDGPKVLIVDGDIADGIITKVPYADHLAQSWLEQKGPFQLTEAEKIHLAQYNNQGVSAADALKGLNPPA